MASICIASLNYAPEPIGIGPYSQGWAEGLAARGHEVQVICGVPYYPQWARFVGFADGFAESVEGGVRILRVPHYIPARPSGMRRLLHYASFARNLSKGLRQVAQVGVPDAVIAVAPALLAAPAALRFAQRASALSWLHVQDFEVEAAVATGLLPAGLAGWSARFEQSMLRKFDCVSSIAPRMVARVAEKRGGSDGVYELRNWAETAVGSPAKDGARMRRKLGLPDGVVALYSGNLARKQGIAVILEAARRMQGRAALQFVICGEGPSASEVEAAAHTLPNLHFRPLQPREDLADLLAMADIHLLPQIARAADLVLPSKLANMLASGRPVIATADKGTALAREVEGCGYVVPTGSVSAFARTIDDLASRPDERARLGAAARDRGQERWSRDRLLTQFAEVLEAAIAGRKQ